MPMRTTALKAALVASITAFSAVSAAAESLDVYVYEKGFLPNTLYMGDADSIRFVNKTGRSLGLDYTYGSIMVNSFSAGGTVTVSTSAMWNKTLKQPWVFGRGYLSSSARFSIKSGEPPLQ